jgi:hypothetical protein
MSVAELSGAGAVRPRQTVTSSVVANSRLFVVAGELCARAVLAMFAFAKLPHVFTGDVEHYRRVALSIGWRHLPYRQVFWEYPPLALVPLLVRGVSFGTERGYVVAHVALMIACEYGALTVLRRSFPERSRTISVYWSLAVLPLASCVYFRNDFLAMFFAAWAIVAIERSHTKTPSIALGFAAKLWPAVFLGVVAVQRRWRDLAIGSAAIAVTLIGWYAWSPAGLRHFLNFRQGSGLEVESLPASVLLALAHRHVAGVAGAWVIGAGHYQAAANLSYLLLAAWGCLCFTRARHASSDLVALGGALVVALMIISRILSPQYLVWCAPAVAILWARGRRAVGSLYIAASWLTVWELLRFDPGLVRQQAALAERVLLSRNALLVALLVALFVAIRPKEVVATNVVPPLASLSRELPAWVERRDRARAVGSRRPQRIVDLRERTRERESDPVR